MPEFTCGVCQRKFHGLEFGDNAVCDECQDERPGLADLARMAADCEPPTSEEEARWDERSMREDEFEQYWLERQMAKRA